MQQGDAPSSPQDLANAFLAVHVKLRRRVDAALADVGLSLARHRLLAMVGDHGPCRLTDIASHFAFAPRSVTEAVDALERDGLVMRVPDPHDRRAKRVSLTETGQDALRVAGARRQAVVEAAFEELDEAQRGQLQALLGSVLQRLSAQDGERA